MNCTQCGQSVSPGGRFCPACGAPVEQTTPVSPPFPPQGNPAQYGQQTGYAAAPQPPSYQASAYNNVQQGYPQQGPYNSPLQAAAPPDDSLRQLMGVLLIFLGICFAVVHLIQSGLFGECFNYLTSGVSSMLGVYMPTTAVDIMSIAFILQFLLSFVACILLVVQGIKTISRNTKTPRFSLGGLFCLICILLLVGVIISVYVVLGDVGGFLDGYTGYSYGNSGLMQMVKDIVLNRFIWGMGIWMLLIWIGTLVCTAVARKRPRPAQSPINYGQGQQY